jgi:hypothetical protein
MMIITTFQNSTHVHAITSVIISKYVKNIYFQFVESIIEYVVYLDKIFIEISIHVLLTYSQNNILDFDFASYPSKNENVQLENEMLCYIKRIHVN